MVKSLGDIKQLSGADMYVLRLPNPASGMGDAFTFLYSKPCYECATFLHKACLRYGLRYVYYSEDCSLPGLRPATPAAEIALRVRREEAALARLPKFARKRALFNLNLAARTRGDARSDDRAAAGAGCGEATVAGPPLLLLRDGGGGGSDGASQSPASVVLVPLSAVAACSAPIGVVRNTTYARMPRSSSIAVAAPEAAPPPLTSPAADLCDCAVAEMQSSAVPCSACEVAVCGSGAAPMSSGAASTVTFVVSGASVRSGGGSSADGGDSGDSGCDGAQGDEVASAHITPAAPPLSLPPGSLPTAVCACLCHASPNERTGCAPLDPALLAGGSLVSRSSAAEAAALLQSMRIFADDLDRERATTVAVPSGTARPHLRACALFAVDSALSPSSPTLVDARPSPHGDAVRKVSPPPRSPPPVPPPPLEAVCGRLVSPAARVRRRATLLGSTAYMDHAGNLTLCRPVLAAGAPTAAGGQAGVGADAAASRSLGGSSSGGSGSMGAGGAGIGGAPLLMGHSTTLYDIHACFQVFKRHQLESAARRGGPCTCGGCERMIGVARQQVALSEAARREGINCGAPPVAASHPPAHLSHAAPAVNGKCGATLPSGGGAFASALGAGAGEVPFADILSRYEHFFGASLSSAAAAAAAPRLAAPGRSRKRPNAVANRR